MIQRIGKDFVLICTIVIIFAFCITEDKAGVVLRNFKSRRTIMEELEEEEKALKASLSLNITNSTVASNETVKTLMDKNLNHSSDKIVDIDDWTIGLKNISKSQTKNLKMASKKKTPNFKSQKSVVIPQARNKTSTRKPNILMNSFVEYLENADKGWEDESLKLKNDNTNKISSRKILTKSFVEYMGNRGKRMVDTILASENDKNATPIWISDKVNASAPFRLISLVNESVIINEIGENSSLAKSVDLENNKEISEAEPEEMFTMLQDLVNHTLKDSQLDAKENTTDWQQFDLKKTDMIKETFMANISGLPEDSISEMSLTPQKNNDIKIPEESESTELEKFVSASHAKLPELKIPSNIFLSGVPTEEQSNFTVNIINETSKKSLDNEEMVNHVKQKETVENKSLIDPTVNQTEEDMKVKQFELQESSDIIKQTAKEIEDILPATNETIAVEDIEEFVVDLTDTVQSMSDEDIIHLEPEDEQISQSAQNENNTEKEISATILDTQKEFELNLESVVSSGIDFIANSEVAKNAAMAMEVFNLSDSSLADHVIEDSDMHSFIDIMMPSAHLNEIESVPEDRESIEPKETFNSSLKLTEIEQKNSVLNSNSTFNASIVKDDIANAILESTLHSNAHPNATSVATERICPTPGICIFWFMARDTCTDDSQCLGEKMCCRVRCSKNCIDV